MIQQWNPSKERTAILHRLLQSPESPIQLLALPILPKTMLFTTLNTKLLVKEIQEHSCHLLTTVLKVEMQPETTIWLVIKQAATTMNKAREFLQARVKEVVGNKCKMLKIRLIYLDIRKLQEAVSDQFKLQIQNKMRSSNSKWSITSISTLLTRTTFKDYLKTHLTTQTTPSTWLSCQCV